MGFSLVNLATVIVASAAGCWCLSGTTAACTGTSGENLAAVKAGLMMSGVSDASGCLGMFESVLDPSSASRTTQTQLYGLVLSLANQSLQCNASERSGSNLLNSLGTCNCSQSPGLLCEAPCLSVRASSVLTLVRIVNSSECNSSPPSLRITAGLVESRFQLSPAFMLRLLALLESIARANAVTAGLVGQSSFRDSTVSSTMQSSLSSSESLVLVCSAMFPICWDNSSDLVPVCPSVCDRLAPPLRLFDLFTNTSTIPVGALLKEAYPLCELSATNGSLCLGKVIQGNTSAVGLVPDHLSGAGVGTFCLNLACPYPLIHTDNADNWNMNLQRAVVAIHGAFSRAFPGSSIPYNGSQVLPCGTGCVAVGMSDTAVRVSRIFLSTSSTVAVLVSALSAIVFFFNRERLKKRLVRRNLLIFTTMGGFASVAFLPSAYNDHENLMCHDDGTLLLREPGSGRVRCTLAAIWSYFFVTVTSGYYVALAHSWLQLIVDLGKPNLARKKTSIDVFYRTHRLDIIYAVSALLPPLIMSIVMLALQGAEGNVLNGTCSISVTRNFYVSFYVGYFCLLMVLGTVFLSIGLRQLIQQREGLTGFVNWVRKRGRTGTLAQRMSQMRSKRSKTRDEGPAAKGNETSSASVKQRDKRFSGMARHEKRMRKEINRLAFQILYYCVVAIINLLFTVALGIYIGVKNSEWRDQTEAHVLCTVTSCRPETCTALPKPQPAILVAPLIVQFFSLAIISTWLFTKEYLANVPGLNRLRVFQRDRTDTAMSSGMDSSEGQDWSRAYSSSNDNNLHEVDTVSPEDSPVPSRDASLKPHTNTNGNHVLLALSPLSKQEMDASDLNMHSPQQQEALSPGSEPGDANVNAVNDRRESARSRAGSRTPLNSNFVQSDV